MKQVQNSPARVGMRTLHEAGGNWGGGEETHKYIHHTHFLFMPISMARIQQLPQKPKT
jgi:hypothetical protein